MSHDPNQIAARLVLEMWAKHHTNSAPSSMWSALKESKNLPMSQGEAHLSVTLMLNLMGATAAQVRHLQQWYRLHGAQHVAYEFTAGVRVDLDVFRIQVEMQVEEWFEMGQVRVAA